MSIISNGYRLPFTQRIPPPAFEKNNASSLKHKKIVEESIKQLQASGCIQEVTEIPHCVNPLTVAEGKKLRMVLDLRNVNKYLDITKFKYENLRTVADNITENDFFVTFDLKSGYHHVPIAKEHQTYLGFSWDFFHEGQVITKFFVFLVLAFGLATAGYVFTKVMRPLVKKWRREGKKSSIYLDDGILANESYAGAKTIAKEAVRDISQAGLTINMSKSKLSPTKSGVYLGFIIDTEKMEFVAPAEKIQTLKNLLRLFIARKLATPKEIAKIAGRIISLKPAIGTLTSLFTRHQYKFIESRSHWHERKQIPQSIKDEFTFWLKNLDDKNGHCIKNNPSITKIVYSDASDRGYGGYIVQKLGNTVAQGSFSRPEQNTSSTHRELLAVVNILKSFTDVLRNENILWHSDNSNVGRIIEVGSTKPDLQEIALQIYEICIANNNRIFSVWIPREENTLADYYARPSDTDNFGIDYKTFYYIQRSFGMCNIDRFADDKNTKLKRFNSKYFCPNTEAVNAFTCNWEGDFNWLCPPINLIGDTIKHAALCKAKGILMVPLWESSYFYPIIWNGMSFRNFVKRFLVVNPSYYSSADKSVFKGRAEFKSLALLIDFS